MLPDETPTEEHERENWEAAVKQMREDIRRSCPAIFEMEKQLTDTQKTEPCTHQQ